ncbi:hypothetical protein GCM10009795_017860 [Nocardioides hankookensis]
MCDGYHHGTLPTAPPDRTALTRRATIAAGAGLLMAGTLGASTGAIADTGRSPRVGAARRSRLTRGTRLLHADLHNHTLLSDGDGDPALAFDSMRSAGLDVAALTDHATLSDNLLGDVLAGLLPPEYSQLGGITRTDWHQTRAYADAANVDGAFTAIRGFEWSEPLLGHVNVWFSEHYTDVLEAGLMQPLLSWLRREPGLVLDGGADGLAGFNHPGREPGRFQGFHYDERVRDRVVSLEMFNRRDDFVFEGYADGRSSPLVACLNAGWRTGIAGCTDEHGTDWGFPEGKGRTGMWVTDHSRAGVKAAMRARRFFATRTSGLRVDATATPRRGTPHRMGSVLSHDRGAVRIRVDLARDASWIGRPLTVQVLRPGTDAPTVGARRGVPGRSRRRLPGACRRGGRRLDAAADRGPVRAERHPRTRGPPLQRPGGGLHQPVVVRAPGGLIPYGSAVTKLGRATLLWMIPVNLLLLVWVWIGRIVFGVGGWFFVIFLVSVVPVVLIALTLTTALAYTQDGRPRALTRVQAWAQLVTWIGLLGFGAFCPDFGDTDDSQISLLTQVFGQSDSLIDLSVTITIAFGLLAVAAYVVLLVALVFARRDSGTITE